MDRDGTLTHALSISRACHRPGTQWHLTAQFFNQCYKNQISVELHYTQDYISLLIQKTAYLLKRQEVQYTHTHTKETVSSLQVYILKCYQYNSYLKSLRRDLPGGPVVKNLSVNAGDMGSVPGLGTKIPHARRQPSLCSTQEKPTHHDQQSLYTAEQPLCHNRSQHLVTRESPHTAMKSQCNQNKSKEKRKSIHARTVQKGFIERDLKTCRGRRRWDESIEQPQGVKSRHSVVSDSLRPHGLQPTRFLHPWNFLGKSTGVGCHFLLQGIFPTEGSTRVSHIAGRRFTA